MRTRSFRLLTVCLTAVMIVALSLNVMAAKSSAVTQDGLTAQLFTDKDSYKAGESVKVSVQVDNHTGREVFIFTQINVPESVKLAGDATAFDARLQDGETWLTPGGENLIASNATVGTAATGDNMQAGLYVILTALAVCGIVALFVYGKNRKTWLSVLLCLAMVAGMAVAAVPARAADMNSDMELSCAIQVDGKDTLLTATVSYVIYDEAEEAEESAIAPTEAPEVTEAPAETESPASTETPVETEAPTQIPSEAPTTAPTEEPTPTPTVVPTEAPTPTPTVAPTQEPVAAVEEIYVDTSATAGEGDGTIEKPFANIGEAKALIRKINNANVYPANGITVYLRGGEYRINEKITFEETDSGKEGAPVVYKAYNNEKVVFIGGADIELSEFSVVDQAISDRLVADAVSHIKQFDLKTLGLTLEDLGEMNLYGAGLDYFNLANVTVPKTQAPELFYNGETMNIAKYPNTGWLKVASVVDTGDVVQNWTTAADGNKYVEPEDRPTVPRGSTFTVDADTQARMARWTNANDLWVYGYWRETWHDQSMPVATIDASTGTVVTDIPSGKDMTLADPNAQNYYFYNLLEELDTEGEYYIDRESGILYFYPPADASSGTVTLSLLGSDMIRLEPGTHDIDFVGIEIKAGRVVGISATGAERINVINCDISKMGGRAYYLKDCKNVVIKDSHLYDLGVGGVYVTYDKTSEIGSDMLTNLTPSGIVIDNCEINNFSRIKQTYSPAVQMAGVGMVVRNCKIHDSTHMAIQFCADSAMSNDSIIENNEIYNVLQTSTDSGVFYGGFAKEQMGIIIRNNYIHDIESSKGDDISVVYCDDTKDGVTVESNLIVNFKGKGILLNGGWDNVVRNNVFVNTKESVVLGAIGMRGNASYYSNVQAKYDVANHALYSTFRNVQSYSAYQKYPHWNEKLADLTTYNAPRHNRAENNVIINTVSDTRFANSSTTWSTATMKEQNTINDSYKYSLSEVGFADIKNNAYTVGEDGSVTLTNGDFTLATDSVLFTDIPDFTPFDFANIGLRDGSLEKAGPLGPLEEAKEETDVLYEDDFTGETLNASGWRSVATQNEPAANSGSIATINSAKQMAYTVTSKGAYTKDRYFDAYEGGKVSYEMDFMLKRNSATDIEAKIIALGTNAAGGKQKSLVNIQVKYSETLGEMIFTSHDGGEGSNRVDGSNESTIVCENGVNYKVKLIVDPATDTYDFYVGDTKVFENRNLRKDAGDVTGFDGIRISAGKTSTATGEGQQIEMYIDNLLIKKAAAKTDPKEDYLVEEYFSGASLADSGWITSYNGNPNPTGNNYPTINSAKQMEYLVASKGTWIRGKQFTAYEGKISCEMDLMLITNGATDAEAKMVVVGNNTEASGKSLLNLQTYYVSGKGLVFGAYDGGTDRSTTAHYQSDVVCEAGVWYNVKVVIDPSTDKYDFYVDGTKIFGDRYLRKDAGDVTGFTEIRISAGRTSDGANTDGKQFVMYGDNLIIKKETGVGSTLLTDYFNGESLSDGWSPLLSNAPSDYSLGINSAKQLEIALTTKGAINIDNTSFTANSGVTVYEMDFCVDRNGSTVLDPGVMIAMGEGQSLVNIKAYCDAHNGKVFGAYDGSGENRAGKEHPTTKACEDGVTYRVMLVVDPGTDTYDLYVDGELIIDGSPLRYEVSSVNGIRIAATKKEGDETITSKIYYDNLKVYTLE